MSGNRCPLMKLYCNCDVCGSALSDGVYQCCESIFSTKAYCLEAFCSRCSQHHEEKYNHDVTRARFFDHIIESAKVVCPSEGCFQEIPAAHYHQHEMVCPYKKLLCPLCAGWFVLNELSTHLITCHQFSHRGLEYGQLLSDNDIYTGRGCIFRGAEEDFVFFIASKALHFLWLGSSPASPATAANFKLMAVLIAASSKQDSGSYTDPPLSRHTDVVKLFSFRHITREDAFKISVLVD